MDRDFRQDHPGKCPRCGMTLIVNVPDLVEYPLALTFEEGPVSLIRLRVTDPAGHAVKSFETVHERLLHLFVVSQDLEFFAHEHPVLQADGSFRLEIQLPKSGMYRVLADYYPTGSVPQLAIDTFFSKGSSSLVKPLTTENLTAGVEFEPQQPLAGLETRIHYALAPDQGLEKYLGAWGHMLIASEDLIDMLHLHPFLKDSNAIQFNVIFPRAGRYKIWSQFQRLGVVNTVATLVVVNDV